MMKKAPGVLTPPYRVVNDHTNPDIILLDIGMFSAKGEKEISFSLITSELIIWCFESIADRNLVLQSIYKRLGVIE